jgi:hypothetical protein
LGLVFYKDAAPTALGTGISGCPAGTNAGAKIILRWTFGAFGVLNF